MNAPSYCGPNYNLLQIYEICERRNCAAMHVSNSVFSHASKTHTPPSPSLISISISQTQSAQLKPNSHTTNLIFSPPFAPSPSQTSELPASPSHVKKGKKITGMLKLQRRLQHCGKPCPPSQHLLFSFNVCFFLSACSAVRGSDRVYFNVIFFFKKTTTFLCHWCAQLF